MFWSLERMPGPSRPLGPGSILQTLAVEIEAAGPAGSKARLALERRIAGVGVTRQEIRSDGIVGTLFLPPGVGPHPAVLVVSGAAGNVIEEFRAAVLASHGYAALALAHSGFAGLPAALVSIPLEYFQGAIAWMRRQPWLRDDLLAVWGTSRGGELALLLGATFQEINAVIAWVPSGVAFWPSGLTNPSERHGHFAISRSPTSRKIIPVTTRHRKRNQGHRLHIHRSTAVSCAIRRRSSGRPSPLSKRGVRSCSYRAATIRCGRHLILQTSLYVV